MPKSYVSLSEEKMEYDGGFLSIIVGVIASIASVAICPYAQATDNKTLMAVGIGVGIGVYSLAANGTTVAVAAASHAYTAVGQPVSAYLLAIGIADKDYCNREPLFSFFVM